MKELKTESAAGTRMNRAHRPASGRRTKWTQSHPIQEKGRGRSSGHVTEEQEVARGRVRRTVLVYTA
jgi:hypothetical protein